MAGAGAELFGWAGRDPGARRDGRWLVGTGVAIANAVHRATGISVRDLPIRLDRALSW